MLTQTQQEGSPREMLGTVAADERQTEQPAAEILGGPLGLTGASTRQPPASPHAASERVAREQAAAHLKELRLGLSPEHRGVAAFAQRAGLQAIRVFAIEGGQPPAPATAELMGYVTALGKPAARILEGLAEPGRSYLGGLLGVPAPRSNLAEKGRRPHAERAREVRTAAVEDRDKSPEQFEWGVARRQGQIAFADVRRCIPAFFVKMAQDRDQPEMVFSWASPGGIMVKVYTTIIPKTGLMPRAGNLPIRIIVIDIESYKKIEAWSVSVLRGDDMLESLRVETGRAVSRASSRPKCPRCGGETRFVALDASNQFFGCKSYPACTARQRVRAA